MAGPDGPSARGRRPAERQLEPESMHERVTRIEVKCVLPGDIRLALDLRNDRGQLADHRLSHHSPPEAAADDALVCERLFGTKQPHRSQDGHHGTRPRSARRAIDFSFGEDRDVAKIRILPRWWRGEDGAVDAVETGFEWMLDTNRRLHGILDRHARAPKIVEATAADGDARRFAIDDGVERAAERHIGSHLPAVDLHGNP